MSTIDEIKIPPEASVQDAMERLDATARRILAVVDPDGRLLGVVTDGDVRRFILRQGKLSAPVLGICNKNPVTVAAGASPDLIRQRMGEKRAFALPEVDAEGRLVALHSWEELLADPVPAPVLRRPLTGTSVIVMAGGMGTRLAPVTRVLPKALVPVGDRPIIQHILDRFLSHGVDRFKLVLHHKAEFIKGYFASVPDPRYRLDFHVEAEPCGTMGGLRIIPRDELAPDLMVSNCDILIETDYAEVLAHHRKAGADLTIVGATRKIRVPYGVLRLDGAGHLQGMDEKPAFDFLANTGLYVLRRELLDRFPASGEFHITDLLARLLAERARIAVFPVSERSWLDIGEWPEFDRTWSRLSPGT